MMSAKPDDNPSNDPPHDQGADLPADVPPMTFATMGRLFVVPFAIIAVIVSGAVTVVLLFGGPATSQDRSIDDLLTAIENNAGERSMGVLLPREKELWQAALELSVRLENKEKESLTDENLNEITARLAAMVQTGLADLDNLATVGRERQDHLAVRSRRLAFLIQALGWTDRPEAVDALVIALEAENEALVVHAMQSLGRLANLPESKQAVRPIVAFLRQSHTPEAKLMGSTVLSVLARPNDTEVIETLREIRLSSEGEVNWSASLALARLGSDAGRTTLLDLLDRDFLESGKLYTKTDQNGRVHRYALPPTKVDELMIAAVDAASHLENRQLWTMIEGLAEDRSPSVRGHVMEVLEKREQAQVSASTEG